jgi:hypothetical protein
MGFGTGTGFEGQIKPSAVEVDGYEHDLFAHRYCEIPTNMQARFVYDGSGNCTYAGFAPRGLAEGSNGWLLQKFDYSGSNCTSRTIGYGNWTNYSSASYE